jgi:hypothetical protein
MRLGSTGASAAFRRCPVTSPPPELSEREHLFPTVPTEASVPERGIRLSSFPPRRLTPLFLTEAFEFKSTCLAIGWEGLFVFRNKVGMKVGEGSGAPRMPLRCASSLAKARVRVFPLRTLHDTGFSPSYLSEAAP